MTEFEWCPGDVHYCVLGRDFDNKTTTLYKGFDIEAAKKAKEDKEGFYVDIEIVSVKKEKDLH